MLGVEWRSRAEAQALAGEVESLLRVVLLGKAKGYVLLRIK